MIQPLHVILQPGMVGDPIKWYESGKNARQILDQFPDFTFSHLEWMGYSDMGGYEITYMTKDNGILCHQCANKELERTIDPDDEQFYIVDVFVNYEESLTCDHCGRQIEPAYGDSA